MSVTIIFADTQLPTQQHLEDFPQIILTSQHDWDPHSIRFTKGSHREEEEYLFAGIAEIHIEEFQSKVHQTNIDPGLRDTVNDPYFIVTQLVPQVRIADAKVPDVTRINDPDKEILEG